MKPQPSDVSLDPSPPWAERLPGESPRAFSFFTAWCRMGPTRSFAELARTFRKSPDLFRKWAKRWGWHARGEAYDKMVAAEDARAFEEARRQAQRLRRERELQRRSDSWQLATRLLDRIHQLLQVELVEALAATETTAAGERVERRVVVPAHHTMLQPLAAVIREYNRLACSAVQDLDVAGAKLEQGQCQPQAGERLVAGSFKLWVDADEAETTAEMEAASEDRAPAPTDIAA